MKFVAIASMIAFVTMTSTAFAGVAPNTGASAAARSGARIAPAKPAPQAPSEGGTGDHGSGTAK